MAYSVTHFSKRRGERDDRGTGGRIEGVKLHGASVHGQERRNVMALTVAGFVAGGTQIDTTEVWKCPIRDSSSGWRGWGRGQRLGERGTLRIFAIYF